VRLRESDSEDGFRETDGPGLMSWATRREGFTESFLYLCEKILENETALPLLEHMSA
jgi:hypothetical protein